jgi:acyl carrier protein
VQRSPLRAGTTFDKKGVFGYTFPSIIPRRGTVDKIEIQEKLIDILTKHTSVARPDVTPDKDLKLDLGLDSLDVAEMVFEIEETFGISISDDSAEKIKRIADTVDFIYERMIASDGLPVEER